MRKRSRAKASERKHAVYANLNVPELTKAGSGLELYIYARGEKLGEVDIGRGGFYWKGGGRHRRKRIDCIVQVLHIFPGGIARTAVDQEKFTNRRRGEAR